ncbi:hypothetical protein F4776DRAFT_276707 [Hypoxylon sp. NC0597]|nr:hypothetical protein F4776DRAFT_276707 [Hypoxylon sp. NC0597]
MRLRQLAIDTPAKNTCQWLPKTDAFTQWIERKNVGVHFGLLQIIGNPGCGKSTLMKRLFETTRSSLRAEGTCVAGFFFNARGEELEHCTRGLLRSLLFQVGTSHPACLDSVQAYSITELLTMERTNPRVYVRMLKSILQEIFSNKSVAPQKTVLFIDALDECDYSETSETGHFLAELAESAYQAGVRLNVCISRREYPPIIIRKCLEIQMKDFNTEDIRRYIHEKLDLVGFEPRKVEILAELITRRSNGIFLWVVLAVEGILKDVEDGKNTKYILKRTKRLPKALEDLYASMLENIDPNNRQMALRLFYWAILATGRLRLREWHHILAFIREDPPSSLKEWKESDYYTENDAQLERQIRSLSQGLVEVKGGVDIPEIIDDAESMFAGAGSLDSTVGDTRVVQPIHETVAKFFTEGHADNILRRKFEKTYMSDFTGEGHLSIMGSCLDYISIREFDGYVAARKHGQSWSSLKPTHNLAITSSVYVPLRPLESRQRRYSATSFMSSASSYSTRRNVNYSESDEDSGIFREFKTTPGNLKRRRSTGSTVARANRSVVQLERDVLTAEWLSNTRAKDDSTKDNLQDTVATPDAVFSSSSNPKASDPGILFTAARWTSTNLPSSTDGDFGNQSRSIETSQLNSSNRAVQTTGPTASQEVGSGPQPLSSAVIDDNNDGTAKPVAILESAKNQSTESGPRNVGVGHSSGEDASSDKTSSSWQKKPQTQAEPFAPELNDIAGNHVIASGSCKVDGDDDAADTRSIDDAERQIRSPSFHANDTSMFGSARFRERETFDGDSVADVQSTKSQTLEEYPALASYAINRAFVHARLSRGDPEEIMNKLTRQNCWSRWYALQEGVTTHFNLIEFLESQGLRNWVCRELGPGQDLWTLSPLSSPHTSDI